ncbi:hypothetical protein HOLleu_26358 [Holothuria leucospilota]|uniref:Uncharacterized protein n=1 Tax=Holothuria leucospilota TaxID=206669 RepID=A0A9Q1H2F4_HOLLE|nr:hypothetical protein HOLleu_26358 [Holothuria leucospilota]
MGPSHGNDEMKLATTISVIVGTDMLCWLPIITLSVFSQSGIDIPTKVLNLGWLYLSFQSILP